MLLSEMHKRVSGCTGCPLCPAACGRHTDTEHNDLSDCKTSALDISAANDIKYSSESFNDLTGCLNRKKKSRCLSDQCRLWHEVDVVMTSEGETKTKQWLIMKKKLRRLYLCGSGGCVRGFHFRELSPCEEKTKTNMKHLETPAWRLLTKDFPSPSCAGHTLL